MIKKKQNFDIEWKSDPLKHDDPFHKDPRRMTRRELLGQGFIYGSGAIMAPSLLSAIANQAYGQTVNCGGVAAPSNGKIGFLSIDLSGGAAISGGNVMVGGPGGQMDMLSADGYQFLGFAANTQNDVSNELGLIFHNDSGFLRGIKDKASPEALQRVNGAVAACRLSNDTQNNTQSPLYGISKAGAQGSLNSLIGTRDSDSGGRSRSPDNLINLEVKPQRVSRASELQGTVDTGKMVSEMGSASALKVLNRISRLSDRKKAKLTDGMVQQEILQCGYVKAHDTIQQFGSPAALDVFQDTNLVGQANSIWTMGELNNRDFERGATHAKAIVNGYAGAGVIELGGYDYHNGTRSRGEGEDFIAGQVMGGAIEYAHRLQRPLMVYVFSDGSVRSDGQIDDSTGGRNKGVWRGDSGGNSAAFMLVYNPAGRPQMTAVGNQLGHYIPDGVTNTTANLVANSATNLAYWVILNFMNLNGDVANFATLFPENPFGTTAAQLDPYINFAPLA